jgi:hypothetical protein
MMMIQSIVVNLKRKAAALYARILEQYFHQWPLRQ